MSSDLSQALVKIQRKPEIWGWQSTWIIFVDGYKLASLRYHRSLTFYVPPGPHTIIIRSPKLMVPILFPPIGLISSEPFSFDAHVGEQIELLARATGYSRRPKVWRSAFGSLGKSSPSSPLQFPVGGEAVASSSRPAVPASYTVIEGSRYEIPLGEETRSIDNSKSSAPTVRVVRLEREWVRTCSVDVTNSTTLRGSIELGTHFAGLKAEVERALNKRYSAAAKERETFAEEVTLNILEHTKSRIVFSWKEIRQKGVVQAQGADFEMHIPYEIVVGVTFDQQQIDDKTQIG
jgi:hypothetical protein